MSIKNKIHTLDENVSFRLDQSACRLFFKNCDGKLEAGEYIRVFQVGEFDLIGDVKEAARRCRQYLNGEFTDCRRPI